MNWDHWRGEVAKACDGSHQTIESVERSLAEGRSHALMTEDACFIVELADYPTERACQVMWAAGDLETIKRRTPELEAWAKAQGCTEMLVEGHRGWERALRDIGYRPWSVTVRKAI